MIQFSSAKTINYHEIEIYSPYFLINPNENQEKLASNEYKLTHFDAVDTEKSTESISIKWMQKGFLDFVFGF